MKIKKSRNLFIIEDITLWENLGGPTLEHNHHKKRSLVLPNTKVFIEFLKKFTGDNTDSVFSGTSLCDLQKFAKANGGIIG